MSTNAFDWKSKPSTIGKELQHSEVMRKNARGNKVLTTQPRRFHQFSKAVPSTVFETQRKTPS